jgi:3-deoxy-D-manno-octulosonate 8-phosphate phosphatase (KDO 8-P phosphatase)
LGIALNNVAYIGDDINWIELLLQARAAACPANAREAIKQIPGITTLEPPSGNRAVRDFTDIIVSNL